MKTTFKRALAMIMTLCALLSVMAPAAFAEAETTTYAFNNVGTASWAKQAMEHPSIAGSNWSILAVYARRASSMNNTGITMNLASGYWIAIKLEGVSAGDYTFGMVSLENVAADLYIMPGDTAAPAKADAATFLTTKIGSLAAGAAKDVVTADITIDSAMVKNNSVIIVLTTNGSNDSVKFSAFELTPKTTEEPEQPSISDTDVAAIGEQGYADLDTALNAATEGQTVRLLKNLNENYDDPTTIVKNGAILDLNGYILDSALTAVNGTVIDSSANKTGGVGGSQAKIQSMLPTNPAMALKDSEGIYRFYEFALVAVGENNGKKGTDGAVYFGFGLYFENANAYDLVANGGLEITATLTWSGSVEGSAVIGNMDEAIADWLAAKPTSDDGRCFYIQVTGLEDNLQANDQVTVTPQYTFARTDIIGDFGGAITYIVE